jgi:hypothetical protein
MASTSDRFWVTQIRFGFYIADATSSYAYFQSQSTRIVDMITTYANRPQVYLSPANIAYVYVFIYVTPSHM